MSEEKRSKSIASEEAGVEIPTGDGQPSLQKGSYYGDVSALCLVTSSHYHLLLAGTGPQVLLYDLLSGDQLCSHYVFDGVRVHGICTGAAFWGDKESPRVEHYFKPLTVVIHGERRVKLFKMLQQTDEDAPQLHFLGALPRLSYWVMDVRLVQDERTISTPSPATGAKIVNLLAVGLSNNTISLWDLSNYVVVYHVECSERCLLYSMRLWGDSLETLHAAAGTVFNEVLIWKLGRQQSALKDGSICVTELGEKSSSSHSPTDQNEVKAGAADNVVILQELVDPLQRLIGHEGSIHRLTWSSDGLSVVSVSDDRSARVWYSKGEKASDNPWHTCVESGPVLYGHGSRLWDCSFGEKLLITASEDCTSRVWTGEGKLLATLKGHIGRGIWRCVYDPKLNILVTAGADSSIKVQSLDNWVARPMASYSDQNKEVLLQKQNFHCKLEIFNISPSWSSATGTGPSGFMDSKSEYVRCLALSNPWSLYVCTNQGAIYHVNLARDKETSWTLLLGDLEGPIVCMDVLVEGDIEEPGSQDDMTQVDLVVVANGKGRASVLEVRKSEEQVHCEWHHSWVAEKERQLLGVHWSKSTGRSVFTTNPRGNWCLWSFGQRHSLDGGTANKSPYCQENNEVKRMDLVACGRSSHGRITCIDVSPDQELLVCGDKQGTLTAFSFPKVLLGSSSGLQNEGANAETKHAIELPVVAVFKGAHGISTVTSVCILPPKHGPQIEITSTGSDGCICRSVLDQHVAGSLPQVSSAFRCTGIEKVPALSMIESIESCKGADQQNAAERRIAIGFTGSDFLLWDLTHQCEIMRVMCGGWRRSHDVQIGDIPQLQYCFVFVKEQVLQVQRNWVTSKLCGPGSRHSETGFPNTFLKRPPQSLQGQFHGREIHTVLLLHTGTELPQPASWIATGSEDGGILISRYPREIRAQLDSTLMLGDHIGGSAVKALALVAQVHMVNSGEVLNSNDALTKKKELLFGASTGDSGEQQLLFSAGAKEVLTCWLISWVCKDEGDSEHQEQTPLAQIQETAMLKQRPSLQWLSTHTPSSGNPVTKMKDTYIRAGAAEMDQEETLQTQNSVEHRKVQTIMPPTVYEDDDQRYLALTAFATRCAVTGALISFVVTSSSNATLQLHAFHLSRCSWVELALLKYSSALVLTIKHLVTLRSVNSGGACDVYTILTGASNGNISVWDVTKPVLEYAKSCSLNASSAPVVPLRPLSGRGSQGGRRRSKRKNQLSTPLRVDCNREQDPNNADVPVEMDKLTLVSEASCDHVTWPSEDSGMFTLVEPSGVITEEKGSSLSSNLQFPTEPSTGLLMLNPVQELVAAHQSGINCMSVSRIQRLEMSSDHRTKTVYMVITGGDDQALHLAIFSLQQIKSDGSLYSALADPIDRRTEKPSIERTPAVLHWLSQISVTGAHTSAIKGVWTDGLWAFSTGLDQRLRCWRINISVNAIEQRLNSSIEEVPAQSEPASLVECMVCVVDVPEAAALHVKNCHRGRYQIVVVGRGLQVINFDSNTVSY